jgi:glycerophosphoryl diester phosphodiesterase
VDFFSLQETLITDELITQIHYYKKQVYIWTINDTSEAQYAIYNGIDGVITDTPNDITELYTTMKRNIMSHPRQILSFFGYNIDIPSPF